MPGNKGNKNCSKETEPKWPLIHGTQKGLIIFREGIVF